MRLRVDHVAATRLELERAWLFGGRCSRPPLQFALSISRQLFLGLTYASPTPYLSASHAHLYSHCRPGLAPTLAPPSTHPRRPKSTVDQSLAKAAAYLYKVNKLMYNRMRCSHWVSLNSPSLTLAGIELRRHIAWFPRDLNRTRTLSYRLGGIKSMIAVSSSTGAGTSYHYDDGNDSRPSY